MQDFWTPQVDNKEVRSVRACQEADIAETETGAGKHLLRRGSISGERSEPVEIRSGDDSARQVDIQVFGVEGECLVGMRVSSAARAVRERPKALPRRM